MLPGLASAEGVGSTMGVAGDHVCLLVALQSLLEGNIPPKADRFSFLLLPLPDIISLD